MEYLGHKEIQLEEFEDGYQIKRHGNIARNLSEGEKTAIAFAYFIATLKEDGFILKDSVVVIDDPISSLDSSNLQYAFSFMMSHTQDVGQIFILTHNFSFFKLARRTIRTSFKKQQSKYMVKCSFEGGKRVSVIAALDNLLRTYDSEYHYLFKVLYDCHKKTEPLSFEEIYPLFNMARKVLETFLDFKCPSQKEQYKQMDRVVCYNTKVPYDNSKKKSLLRLVNEASHAGLDSAGDYSFEHLSELKQSIDILMDFMQEIDPDHFKGLCECIGIDDEAITQKAVKPPKYGPVFS